MQVYNTSPRQALDLPTVTGLLQSNPSVQVTAGCEWLNSNLVFVKDISSYLLAGSSVSSDIYATIHRSCSLVFGSDVPFDYASDFVKPYVILSDPESGDTARFNLGVYTLEQPDFRLGVLPSKMTFSGLDLLHLLDQPIGDSYEVASGTDPVAAASALITAALPAATINSVASGKTTTQTYSWALTDSPTYLGVINDLLATVGYLGVWANWEGAFQLVPYVSPALGSVEWSFDLTGTHNVVAEDRSAQQSFYSTPNWWRFVINNLSAAPVEGATQLTYIDNDPTHPGSFANRGRYVRKTVMADAVDYASLSLLAAVTVAADLSPSEVFTVKTSPFPLAWHRDLISMHDPNLANIPPTLSPDRRVLARSWDLDLTGADMSWVWETIMVSNPG